MTHIISGTAQKENKFSHVHGMMMSWISEPFSYCIMFLFLIFAPSYFLYVHYTVLCWLKYDCVSSDIVLCQSFLRPWTAAALTENYEYEFSLPYAVLACNCHDLTIRLPESAPAFKSIWSLNSVIVAQEAIIHPF